MNRCPKGRAQRRPFHPKRFDHGAPITKIDIRPLPILLTCLVAFVALFLKAPTHAVVFDIQTLDEHTALKQQYEFQLEEPINRITLTENDTLLWNCEPITIGQLATLLQESQSMAIEPVTVFDPAPNASYDHAAKLLQVIRASGVAKFYFDGLDQHRSFDSGSWSGRATSESSLALALTIARPDDRLARSHSAKTAIGSEQPCHGNDSVDRAP